MPAFQTARGMRDLLPEEAERLNYIICKARETAQYYGYREVITPVVEPYELLSAKSGEEIRSRMFTFKDLGDRTVALRPEFTASIARLATKALKNEPKPLRIFSVGSVYRYDEPQRGRYREFWQSNFELMGSNRPEADAETILLTNSLIKATGLRNYSFKIGHIGVIREILSQENVDEKAQNAILQLMDKKEYGKAFRLIKQEKCRKTLQGLLELNGNTAFETVEKIKKHVAGYEKAVAAAENLLGILQLVTESGCPIETVEPVFARGLEYYTGLVFEVYVPELDTALGGGGRYDRLIEVFGGEPTPAVGVAHGLDRIALAMQTQTTALSPRRDKRAVVIPVKQELKAEALKISQMLREAGVSVEFEVMGRKMAKALEDADRRKVDFAVIVGEKELKEGAVVVRDMMKHEQTTIEIGRLTEKIRGKDE
ncbi:MAG: histidine--tRNA ligase [Candidatus Bathyarchaeota archaeon]|nr:MAG: histidine--tRNA ligase [Candidatus Bathyarchaeota archaeon]